MIRRKWEEPEGAVTKEVLDGLRCIDSGVPAAENPMLVMSECHERVRLIAEYYDGKLTLKCPACMRKVLIVEVAKE